jgi:hypothetical protein
MADQPQVDVEGLTQALANARLHLDDAARRIPQTATSAIAGRLRAADDNNSSCNTACSCGRPAVAANPVAER